MKKDKKLDVKKNLITDMLSEIPERLELLMKENG